MSILEFVHISPYPVYVGVQQALEVRLFGDVTILYETYFICWRNHDPINRSSRPEVFCKKGVLENFTKFTGKHKGVSFLKKLQAVKFFRTPFFTERLRWLLLIKVYILLLKNNLLIIYSIKYL